MNWREAVTIGVALFASFGSARAADTGWQGLGNSYLLLDQVVSVSIAVADQPLILTRWTGSLITATTTDIKITQDALRQVFDGKWLAAFDGARVHTAGTIFVNPRAVSIVRLHPCTVVADTCADLEALSGQILGQIFWTEQAQALLKLK